MTINQIKRKMTDKDFDRYTLLEGLFVRAMHTGNEKLYGRIYDEMKGIEDKYKEEQNNG